MSQSFTVESSESNMVNFAQWLQKYVYMLISWFTLSMATNGILINHFSFALLPVSTNWSLSFTSDHSNLSFDCQHHFPIPHFPHSKMRTQFSILLFLIFIFSLSMLQMHRS
uniref:Uncharacterized protein n=1 Tax=Rhizophora mucronata TaxID=61149 RepID=A0A2P2P8J9_RHIMU